jgi:hypothetical protein
MDMLMLMKSVTMLLLANLFSLADKTANFLTAEMVL